MKSINFRIIMILLFLVFLKCESVPVVHEPIHDNLIVPGQRVGPVYFGMPMSQIFQELGQPYKTAPDIGKKPGVYGATAYWYNDLGFISIENSTSAINYIQVQSNRYKTIEGVCVGATDFEVRAKMGQPRSVNTWYGSQDHLNHAKVWFRNIGFLENEGVVTDIILPRPNF